MSILKVILLLSFFAFKSYAQNYPHPSIWLDEHNVRFHFDSQLSNLMSTRDNAMKWDSLSQSYKTTIFDRLTYLPFADQTIEIQMTDVDYRDEFQLLKWESFSPERIDSLFQRGKHTGIATLKYDSIGRLTSSDLKLQSKWNYKQRKEYVFQYLKSDSGEMINTELWNREFYWFARYQTSYAGNFMYRPLRIRSVWNSQNYFNKKGLIEKHISQYESKYNQREGCLPKHYIYDYKWDEKGRLLREKYVSVTEEKTKKIVQKYITRDFSMRRDSVLYPLLQTPSIAKWIERDFDEAKLNLIEYVGGYKWSTGTYLVDDHHNQLLRLDTTEYPRQFLYQTLQDTNSIYRSIVSIKGQPNIKDTTPYDPNYQAHLIETRYTQCSIEEVHSRPPGLIDARSINGYRRSEIALNSGWTMILYQHGSSDWHQSRFAVGHVPHIRLDVLNDKYLILDSDGIVRYVGSYRKLAKIN